MKTVTAIYSDFSDDPISMEVSLTWDQEKMDITFPPNILVMRVNGALPIFPISLSFDKLVE